MSSIDVAAPAASAPAYVPSPVTARNVLKQGVIVNVKVPKNADYGSFTRDGATTRFLHFGRLVTGGAVHCFVHGKQLASYIGKTVTAVLTVVERHQENGHKMVYIDFKVSERNLKPSRKVAVMCDDRDWSKRTDFELIKTIDPVRGVIILAPLDAKIELSMPAKTN